MAKSALPIVAIAGAAAFLLMPKKKSKTTSSSSTPSGDPNVIMVGEYDGWDWQVIKSQRTGFAAEYFGEAKPSQSKAWTRVSANGAPSPSTAKNLALEYILDANTPAQA